MSYVYTPQERLARKARFFAALAAMPRLSEVVTIREAGLSAVVVTANDHAAHAVELAGRKYGERISVKREYAMDSNGPISYTVTARF